MMKDFFSESMTNNPKLVSFLPIDNAYLLFILLYLVFLQPFKKAT